tara:strand:- start:203 stop:535 length:333 start_codon:yes stop_codon:yes gene_type:complete
MTYKVKIVEVNKSTNLMHHSYIDLGIFTVNATTHSFLFPAVKTDWGADINDTELEFYVNNKRCKYVGFKELYTQIYGNSFATFEADLIRQIEEVVAKQIVKEYPGTDVNF